MNPIFSTNFFFSAYLVIALVTAITQLSNDFRLAVFPKVLVSGLGGSGSYCNASVAH